MIQMCEQYMVIVCALLVVGLNKFIINMLPEQFKFGSSLHVTHDQLTGNI